MASPRGDISKIREALIKVLKKNEGTGHFVLLYCQEEQGGFETTVLLATVPKEEVAAILSASIMMIGSSPDYVRNEFESKH